jgi:hypothetical protein
MQRYCLIEQGCFSVKVVMKFSKTGTSRWTHVTDGIILDQILEIS